MLFLTVRCIGASSAVPREEPAAFTHQIEEVDRAIDNLQKSGKMFGGIQQGGARRESLPHHGAARTRTYPAPGNIYLGQVAPRRR
jgi:hypothetical protein